jgi:ABC-type transport system involved in multi-copper enzyme maturation permease subunit
MFWTTLRFELKYHMRRGVTWLFFAVLFLLAFFAVSTEAVSVGTGLVRRNSPYALAQLTMILVAVGQVITTALVGTAILRDFQLQTHEMLFTTRLSRWGYLGGRFFGAYVVMVLVFSAIPVGALLGSFMPWADAEKLIAVNPWFYFQPFLLFGLTTLFFISALFFTVGALTRNLIAVYLQGILLLVAWSVTQTLVGERLENDTLSNALDPFGLATLELVTRYWAPVEKNTQVLGLTELVVANRLIWLGVAFALAGVTFLLFRFETHARTLFRRKAKAEAAPVAVSDVTVPAVGLAFGRGAAWRQLIGTARFSFLRIVKDKVFVAIALVGCIDLFMGSWYADSLYGETTWPVTYLVAEIIAGGFVLYMTILATIYAGESVWRERNLRMDQIADAAPVPVWSTAVGKILGVVLSLTVVLCFLVVVGMLVQTFKGYTQYEPGLYLRFLFGTTMPWMVAIVLFSFMVHTLVNNKFVGHVVIIVYWIALITISNLGLEHQLYRFGFAPGFTYSDMNGFGHYVGNLVLSAGYSLGLGLMMAVLAVLLWVRGTDAGGWHARLAAMRRRWTPRTASALGTTVVVILVFGGAIFHNTNRLNTYRTSDDWDGIRADWERLYKPYESIAPPRIVDVDVTVELWPERRAYSLDGRYVVVNREMESIDSILLDFDWRMAIERLEWSRPAREAIRDTLRGMVLFTLDAPLPPGDTMELDYRFSYEAHGFPNSAPNNRIVENGTFLDNIGPSLGYDPGQELSNDDDRRKQDLPARERLPDLDDAAGRRNSQFSLDADEIRFAATIATSPDQIALAPGYLEREWTENGRRWFRYVMDRPMANFAAIVSADYAVRRDRWNDVDIDVYYHSGHEYNVDRMIEAVKASLDYFTREFGPYQHRKVRILEFPRYSSFAQSFATTIPYSEAIGFILRIKDEDDDLDMPFFVTAHEVAHQWWGHQVVGARVQGSALMVESMAEYSALTVMEKKYGRSHAQKFLRHELDRYLRGRSSEDRKEQPLMRTENQAYIHYNKGALALYALRDYIGEDAMNRALRAYLREHAHETAPYSTARDFVGYLRAETPDSLQYVITDLFETITLFDNRAEAATVTRTADGKYAVRLEVSARKVRGDSIGNEVEVPLGDYIDIGVFGEREEGNALGRPLYVQKHRITEARSVIEIVVDEEPRKAGIDPYNKLIDRAPTDNVKDLPRPSGGGG